ncbi:MAG: zf-HC2 domain-containing protein [Rhodoglobus sp.]
MSTDAYSEWDAAYVLGSLSTADRAEFERHLSTCAACSAAVTELAGLPGLLSKLGTEEAVALTALPRDGHLAGARHESGEVQRLAASVSRLRRRSRVTFAAIASGLVAASIVAGFAIGTATVPSSAPAQVVAMTPLEANTMTASLTVRPEAWGTQFDWSCSYTQGDWVDGVFSSKPWQYELVAIDSAGTATVVATWAASEADATGLSAASSLPTDSIRAVEIRAVGSDVALVRAEL